jgi:hypothetical protein
VSAGGVHVIVAGITGVNHQAVNKLHGLGTLAPQLTRHDHLTSEEKKQFKICQLVPVFNNSAGIRYKRTTKTTREQYGTGHVITILKKIITK